jgi:hypothetical protein
MTKWRVLSPSAQLAVEPARFYARPQPSAARWGALVDEG